MTRSGWLALVLLSACQTVAPVARPSVVVAEADADLRAVMAHFVTACEHHDFEQVYDLLSASLQARYTPERLQRDYLAEPLAAERVARLKRALHEPFTRSADHAELRLPAGHLFALVREGDAWRVAALEKLP